MTVSKTTARWKERDAELYGGLPPRYSDYVQKIGAHIVAEIVRLAAPRPGERALDIGAGTGTATTALARALAPVATRPESTTAAPAARSRPSEHPKS